VALSTNVNERNALKGRYNTAARIAPFQGLMFFVLATQGWRPGLSYFALSGLRHVLQFMTMKRLADVLHVQLAKLMPTVKLSPRR